MYKASVPVLAALAIGFGILVSPASVDIATGEYAAFFSIHDLLHPSDIEKREPHKVFVRKTFWNEDDRVLLVDARTTQGKGALMVVEGLPGSDWLIAFKVTAEDGAVFELPVPEGESIPCRILVKSGTAFAVAPVLNAPLACDEAEGLGKTLMATSAQLLRQPKPGQRVTPGSRRIC